MKCHKVMPGCISASAFAITAIIVLHHLRSSHKNAAKKPIEICVFRPTDVIEANQICTAMRSGNVCIVDVTNSEHDMAQRITDYLSGIAIAVNGKFKQLSDKTFVMYLAEE